MSQHAIHTKKNGIQTKKILTSNVQSLLHNIEKMKNTNNAGLSLLIKSHYHKPVQIL